MGWDTKSNGKRYYYRSRRRPDGSVVKEYVGHGPRAERAAQDDAEARLRRGLDRQRWECLWSRVEAAREPLGVLCDWARLLNRAVLVVAGFHLHKSHDWRHRSV